jgi:hypothetical protein
VAALVVAATLVVSGPGSASGPTNVAEDNFARADTVAGWGTTTNLDGLANLAWQGNFSNSALTVITGDAGRIDVTTDGHPLSGYLPVSNSTTADVLGEISFSTVGHGSAALLVQRASSSQFYEALLNTAVGQLQLIRRAAGANTTVGTPMAFTPSPGTNYWLRFDDQHSGATQVLSARVWADGTSEPGSWQTTYTDAAPLSGGTPGALGIWAGGPAATEHVDFHAFAYATSGPATAPSIAVAPSFTADTPGTSAVVGTAYSAYTFAATGDPAPSFTVAAKV